ncbi:solute carrier family 35 member F6 [Frankliniella occidentalis]|uniref:Solute carrier family 35 member F6 n=1 Tax=Frankliniella occidentalis TaxID=133901 RepID=A0A6J1SNJ0_FRAOC|nr:solute carrier family 35 member F6 [Frankliniella occidentalis]XP_052127449.1 solute carrier family 35 member F6 [Frankliniella occidentalis]
MEWTKYRMFLALLLVVTGSINTLSTKWADFMESVGLDGQKRHFVHPFLQASTMFLGEMACLATFKILYWYYSRRQDGSESQEKTTAGNTNFKALILLPPAMCDMIATSTMYIGLNLTYASSFQMLRGSVIVFVALLSMAFLDRKLRCVEWFGIIFVLSGLSVVGMSDFASGSSSEHKDTNSIITGDLLIIAAQIITAFQMVYEEKFVKDKDIPALMVVGYEGLWGFVVLGSLLVPFYWIPAYPPFSENPRNVLEDTPDGLVQLFNNGLLLLAMFGTFVSIAFFNFAGVSVTKEMSATTRMVLDSVRTLVIWVIGLALEWQTFNYLQVIGFALLLVGMCLYNNVLLEPAFKRFMGYMNRRAASTGRFARMEEEEAGVLDSQRADRATAN